MAAPAGNSFWKQRSSHGRKPIFPDAETLWAACCEYFQWVEDNPLQEAQAFAYQGDVKLQNIPKMRAMTISGLCIFLDVDRSTWVAYGERDGFSSICRATEEIIRTQKFEGASAGLLNASIIARELGLADKQEFTGKDGLALAPIIIFGEAEPAPAK